MSLINRSDPLAPALVTAAAHITARRVRPLRGPNYWRLAPVVACDLHLGEAAGFPAGTLAPVRDRLVGAVPSLLPDVPEWTGAMLPRVVAALAVELQRASGSCDAEYARAVPSGDAGVWWVLADYDEEDVGVRALRDAVDMLRCALSGEPLEWEERVADLHDLWLDVRLGPSTGAIVEEARRRGIPVRRLNSRSLIQLGLGRNLRRVQASMTERTSAIAVELAQDKDVTKRVLESVGLPVPRGDVAHTEEEAVAIADEIGYPVILKPLDANHGRGISGRLADADAVRAAWPTARAHGHHIVVETFAEGRDHRVLVVNGRLVAVAERVPAHVVGDGTRSVRELIAEANRDPRRGVGHTSVLTRLPADEATADFLANTGRSLDTVPADGEMVLLRGTANLSTGGTSIDRTDEIHPENVTACELAATAIGLDVAGLDVITPDVSIPFRESGSVIIEVNAAPGLRMHTHPAEGKARNVAGAIVEMLYPPGTPSEIPIISITGTNGKTTTSRLIAHLFRHHGKVVGLTTTDGVYLQNRLVMEGDMTGPFAANIILSNPTVDVAVLETARGGLLRAGLGFDECDVGIVLNVSADHLGLGGITTVEQLADVKSVIPAVTKRDGHVILNADDPLVLAMRDRTNADVVLVSTQDGGNEELERHVARNGIGACVDAGQFVLRRGRLRIPIAHERDVPLMLGGAARFQRANILAAICAAYVRGVRYDEIRAGLLNFLPSPSLTPGRLNYIRLERGAALVDYGHNPAAITGLMDMVMRLDAKRRIGVLAAPGDRRDEDIRELGRLCAVLDGAIVRDDEDLRGREPGETPRLIAEGLRAGGMSPDRITFISEEFPAIDAALAQLEEGHLAVILASDVMGVLDKLRPVMRTPSEERQATTPPVVKEAVASRPAAEGEEQRA